MYGRKLRVYEKFLSALLLLRKISIPFPFAVRTVGSQSRLVQDYVLTNKRFPNGFLMSPKALRRRGGLSALADTAHAVAAPLPYWGAACVTRELGSWGEP